jgi:hypothetical protein
LEFAHREPEGTIFGTTGEAPGERAAKNPALLFGSRFVRCVAERYTAVRRGVIDSPSKMLNVPAARSALYPTDQVTKFSVETEV